MTCFFLLRVEEDPSTAHRPEAAVRRPTGVPVRVQAEESRYEGWPSPGPLGFLWEVGGTEGREADVPKPPLRS